MCSSAKGLGPDLQRTTSKTACAVRPSAVSNHRHAGGVIPSRHPVKMGDEGPWATFAIAPFAQEFLGRVEPAPRPGSRNTHTARSARADAGIVIRTRRPRRGRIRRPSERRKRSFRGGAQRAKRLAMIVAFPVRAGLHDAVRPLRCAPSAMWSSDPGREESSFSWRRLEQKCGRKEHAVGSAVGSRNGTPCGHFPGDKSVRHGRRLPPRVGPGVPSAGAANAREEPGPSVSEKNPTSPVAKVNKRVHTGRPRRSTTKPSLLTGKADVSPAWASKAKLRGLIRSPWARAHEFERRIRRQARGDDVQQAGISPRLQDVAEHAQTGARNVPAGGVTLTIVTGVPLMLAERDVPVIAPERRKPCRRRCGPSCRWSAPGVAVASPQCRPGELRRLRPRLMPKARAHEAATPSKVHGIAGCTGLEGHLGDKPVPAHLVMVAPTASAGPDR